MTQMQNRKIAALLVLLLICAGCAHRVGSNAPVTAYEQVMTYNASLATTNDEVAKAIIQAQQMNVLSQKEAVLITEYQVKLAKTDKELNGILRQGPKIATANAASIQNLINQLTTTTSDLLSSGVFENKNLALLKQEVGSVSVLATQLLSTLEAAGVVKP